MGKVIKSLNRNKIKLNITAVYSFKQTKQILRQQQKNKSYYLYICRKNGDLVKTCYTTLKKVLKFQISIKMFQYFGQALEKRILFPSKKFRMSYNNSTQI